MKFVSLVLFLFVAISSSATPAMDDGFQVVIKTGFLTANEYLVKSADEQRAYVMGSLDGMFLAPLLRAPKSRLAWLETCTVGMSNEQIRAIFEQYLQRNPGKWHLAANLSFYNALWDSCGVNEQRVKN